MTTDDGNCLRLRWVFASLSSAQPNRTEHKTLYVILNVVTHSWHVPISIVDFCFASSCTYACTNERTIANVNTVHALPSFHAHTHIYTKHTIFRVLPKMNILTFSICDDTTSLFILKWNQMRTEGTEHMCSLPIAFFSGLFNCVYLLL